MIKLVFEEILILHSTKKIKNNKRSAFVTEVVYPNKNVENIKQSEYSPCAIIPKLLHH